MIVDRDTDLPLDDDAPRGDRQVAVAIDHVRRDEIDGDNRPRGGAGGGVTDQRPLDARRPGDADRARLRRGEVEREEDLRESRSADRGAPHEAP
jgi:hypothetical protein